MRSRAKKKKSEIKRVVLYTRVSTTEQAEKDLSLPAQADAIERRCSERQYELVRKFEEPGATGTDDNRPAFQEMLEYVFTTSNDIDAILVFQSSRFMRNAGQARVTKEALKKAGVWVISVSQETNDDPHGRLMEGFFELIDQWESEVNGLRTSAAMKECARQGYFPSARPPFGFKIRKVEVKPGLYRNKLVPDPQEIPVLTEAFRMYVCESGAKSVGRKLNKRGYRNRNGKRWGKAQILQVIGESAAIGTYYYGQRDSQTRQLRDKADWIPIPVEAILEKKLFDMAQRIRKKREPAKNAGRLSSSPLLFAGYVRCGQCGASYQLETSAKTLAAGTTYTYRYYQCRSAARIGKEECVGFRIRKESLEQGIMDAYCQSLVYRQSMQTVAARHHGRKRRPQRKDIRGQGPTQCGVVRGGTTTNSLARSLREWRPELAPKPWTVIVA